MSIYKFLQTEGSEKYVVLCYAVFQGAASRSSQIHGLPPDVVVKYYELTDSDAHVQVALFEAEIEDAIDIAGVATSLLDHSSRLTGAFMAVCMFDAIYQGVDALFASETANQIYGFSSSDGVIFSNSESLLASRSWADMIQNQKEQIDRMVSSCIG